MKSDRILKRVFTYLYMIFFVFMCISITVLFLDFKNNKGIVPLLFIFSTFFYIFVSFDPTKKVDYGKFKIKDNKKSDINILTLFFSLLSILFFIVSFFVFWI